MSAYNNNYQNQIGSRSVAGTLDVLGIANPTASVTVNTLTANRHGEYFHYPLAVDNSTAAQYPLITVVSAYGATQTTTGRMFLPPATESFGYDTDGNLTSDGRWSTYVWDGENRLLEMRRDTGTPSLAQQRLTFEYDYLGRRIRKAYYTWVSGVWAKQRDTAYLYDGWNMVGELDANNSNAKLRTYVWGNDLSGTPNQAGGVGGLLWVNNVQSTYNGLSVPTGVQFAAYDGNSNVVGLVAAADGTTTTRYEYGPFGEPLRTTGALAKANPVRFSTKVTDDESGLVYYGYRYYNPVEGRWLGRDPIWEYGGENIYGFVYNNSIYYIDILGFGRWRVSKQGGIKPNTYQPETNPNGFKVQYIPDKGECPDGEIIIYQIKGGAKVTRVDGAIGLDKNYTFPTEGCKAPQPSERYNPKEYSYVDSPSGYGHTTHTMTAVAVCRKNCKDVILSTYYFKFSDDTRLLDKSTDDDSKEAKSHFKDGMDNYKKSTHWSDYTVMPVPK